MHRSRAVEPVLITSASMSADEEYDRRRKKYAIMMGLRALCVLGAALTYRVSILLALAFVVGGVVLPWCAVIIANDGPVKRRDTRAGFQPDVYRERALPSGEDDRTVDG